MKTCSKCKTEKPLDGFGKSSSYKDGRQYYCKECASKYHSEWKSKSPGRKIRHAEWKVQRIKENREKLLEHLKANPCVDCGESDIRVLEFDHLRDKVRTVGRMVAQGASWEKILDEIDKCEVCCANCHRIRTAKRGGYWYMAF